MTDQPKGPLMIHHERFGDLDLEKLAMEIGELLLTAPQLADFAGTASMHMVLETYVHPQKSWTAEKRAALHYVTTFLYNDTKRLLKEWFPALLDKGSEAWSEAHRKVSDMFPSAW